MKRKLKWAAVISMICMLGFAMDVDKINADEVQDVTQQDTAQDFAYLTKVVPYFGYDDKNVSLDKKGKTKIIFYGGLNSSVENGYTVSQEVQFANNKDFKNAKTCKPDDTYLELEKKQFGKNGGKFYFRVRNCIAISTGEVLYSDWSETKEYIFVAINKTNFPGMYKMLRKGGQSYNIMEGVREKIVYDTNGDKWLDPAEIKDIWEISTENDGKMVNGVYHRIKAINVSSLKGVEYLTGLRNISLARYSGKKADASKTEVVFVNIKGITAKEFTLIAPKATNVSVEADESAKISKIDLSRCANAVDVLAYGNDGTKNLKLPKVKTKMKVLSLSEIGSASVNLNGYKNLQQVYFYNCDMKNVKVNKCKNLHYIYFWYCNKIRNLNLTSNKKLVGADIYATKGLTKTSVKAPKKSKVTWDKGKWWYYTDKYKNEMKNLYK